MWKLLQLIPDDKHKISPKHRLQNRDYLHVS
jgi:hypothetical protein